MMEKTKQNLHKLITFTVVTCEAQWRKVIFTTINLTTFCLGRQFGVETKPETWEKPKILELKKAMTFLLIPKNLH
jgi:hypothetical protein